MKVWLPYTRGGSGSDVFTAVLARGLEKHGVEVVEQALPHNLQYAPWLLKYVAPPRGTQVTIANTWNGFAFRRPGITLLTIEHLFVLDPAFRPFRSLSQGVFHETLVRHYERASMRASDVQVAVSEYTARVHHRVLKGPKPQVILNGVDTDFFTPPRGSKTPLGSRPFRLLFVGNLTRRKGVDMLAPIMDTLGPGFELEYAVGLRTSAALRGLPNARNLGRLDHNQLRAAYRRADLLLFPSRLEGLPLVAIEAMACGTPVIASNTGPLAEVIKDRENGLLCDVDQHAEFVSAIQRLRGNPNLLLQYCENARRRAEEQFSLKRMVRDYMMLLYRLLGKYRPNRNVDSAP